MDKDVAFDIIKLLAKFEHICLSSHKWRKYDSLLLEVDKIETILKKYIEEHRQ